MSVKYVEYLEAIDKASYIDTGISQNSTTVENRRYEYSMMWYNIGVGGVPAGISQNTWNQLIGLYANNGNVNTPVFSGNCGVGNLNSYEKLSASVNVKYDIIMDYKNGYAEIKQGDDIIYTSNEFVKGENNYPKCTLRIFIGKDDNTGTPQYYINGRIYYFKVYDNEELIQDLRPCLDNNNTPCMYDTVTETYYYNQGTGTFKYGKLLDALYLFADNNEGTAENLGSYRLYNMKIEGDSEGVESGINYVDCLIGDSASYIDTGIAVATGYQMDVTFMLTDKTSYSGIGGTIYGSANPLSFASDNTYGTSVAYVWNGSIVIRDNGSGGVNNHYGGLAVNESTCLNNKYTLSRKLVNVSNKNTIYLMANNTGNAPDYGATSSLRVYDFKIYNDSNTLLIHLRPCLDEEGVPCMYDEVSGEYFHNQGTGTFGYKKKLRDFQPVLDSNGVPCLMDKVNKKYYYDKNGKGFGCEEGYTPVSYLQGDGSSWINTGIIPTENIKIIVNGHFSQVKQYDTLFGGDGTKVQCGANSNQIYAYSGQSQHLHAYTNAVNIPHIYTLTHTQLKIDNDVLSLSSTGTIQNYSIILFGGWSKGVIEKNYLSQGKVYYFKIYQSDELVFDGIPVLDNEGTPCLYDLVTETFFYNQGTGEFSYGIEELDGATDTYTPIKYIESNGTQYIDTGVVPTDNTDIDMVASACESKTIVLDYCYTGDGHYYTPKFPCNEVNNTITNNSDHSIIADFYGDDGAWKWQGEIKSGATENLSQHSYVGVRFTAKDQINYVNDYIFIQGEQSYSSKPGNTDLVISLQDCMSIGYLMNDLIIGGTYKFKETDTTVEPNLTASTGATLTLGSTYMAYLTESEIEQAVDNGWTIQ